MLGTWASTAASTLPSTAELPARPAWRGGRVRWLGHTARKRKPMVKQLLFSHSVPGHSRPMGRPHLTWMDTAMHDIGSLRYMLQVGLPRDWANLALCRDAWRGAVSQCTHYGGQPVYALWRSASVCTMAVSRCMHYGGQPVYALWRSAGVCTMAVSQCMHYSAIFIYRMIF